ncbi:MAG TPA: hypothetical protein VFN95_17520 [Flavitalea sp.]|nr:hypothetical protein [Flavitalea sp.]
MHKLLQQFLIFPVLFNSLGEHFELMAWWRIAYAVAPVYGSLNAIASSVITTMI